MDIWKKGRREGNGTLVRANGVKYVGEWVNDMANGKGVLTDGKGKVVFKGRWKDGLFYFIICLIIFYIVVDFCIIFCYCLL
jgi:hypothetical protein